MTPHQNDSAERVIAAVELTKTFGARRAVDGINFSVERGETYGLLGPNGAGKSTTMRLIACRSPLSGGELLVENLDVRSRAREIRRLIGVVPQENNLDPDLNVWENLTAYARYFRLPPIEAEKRISELLGVIRLTKRRFSSVEELSGGMKRRLMIARALLHRPSVLLLDEPTTGLDPNVRLEIWEKLEELRLEENLTILLSTHYMDEAEKLCQRLLVLSAGKIVAAGAPRDLIRAQVNLYALEIRNAAGFAPPLFDAAQIRAVTRGTVQLFFAAAPELLTPLITHYHSSSPILRPANLEDVFLELTTDEEN